MKPTRNATLRALRGEPEPHIIIEALRDPQAARILALAPGVDPIISALGALAGGLPNLLTPALRDSPALSTAIASLIGTKGDSSILPPWADIAPAGWGAAHTVALSDAVQRNRCEPWVAAALIGPSATSAALLRYVQDIAHAVRRWGMATPNDPTAWMNVLPSPDRDRLLDALRAHPDVAARCLPWLPTECAEELVGEIRTWWIIPTLDAYIDASPVAHTRHAAILSDLVQYINPHDIAHLTRLAVATGMDEAWDSVIRFLRRDSWLAGAVVTAAPWEHVRADVQNSILSGDHQSRACAAIAFARGERSDPPPIMPETARAFFAAVRPEVWTALPHEMQQAWCIALDERTSTLAVRSLGPDPAFLASVVLSDDLIAAVRHRLRDDAAIPQTLLPVAVHELPVALVPDVVAALPKPSNPAAFVQIACGKREMSPVLHNRIAADPTPHALAGAITALRVAARYDRDTPANRCVALGQALAGLSATETAALLAALPKDALLPLLSDRDALADVLPPPDRRDAFRQTLDAIITLPPSVAIPALHALATLAEVQRFFEQRNAGAGLATALRNHGHIFADITKALDDAARSAVLPRLGHPYDESALEPLVIVDPLVAHHVAHALHNNTPTAALDPLATMETNAAAERWYLLPDTIRSAVLNAVTSLVADATMPGCADALAQALRKFDADDPQPLLALRMLGDPNDRTRVQGAAILARYPNLAASLLPFLRDDVRTALESVPAIASAGADPPRRTSTSVRRGR